MKALVTGAGGFVGSHLLPFLHSEGVEVEALSSRHLPGVRCHNTNWRERRLLTQLLERIQPDAIFHLAATGRAANPSEMIAVNALYASHLLEAMVESQVLVPTLMAGSAAEYGRADPSKGPLTEDIPARPESPYAASKYLQSTAALFAAKRGVPVVVARVFNLLGSGMPDTLVLGKFLDQLAESSRAHPGAISMGNIRSQRDFIDVRDAVRIFWKLLRAPEAIGQVVNVCSGQARRISEILSRIQELCHTDVPVLSEVKRDSSDLDWSCGSTAKLHRIIGNFPLTPIDESLKEIARSFSLNLDRNSKKYVNQ